MNHEQKEAEVPVKKPNKKKAIPKKKTSEPYGEFGSIMKLLKDGSQPIIKNKSSNTYLATVTFSSDRRLTKEELDRLSTAVHVQVEEPAGLEGSKRADYSVADVKTLIKRTRKINRRKK